MLSRSPYASIEMSMLLLGRLPRASMAAVHCDGAVDVFELALSEMGSVDRLTGAPSRQWRCSGCYGILGMKR